MTPRGLTCTSKGLRATGPLERRSAPFSGSCAGSARLHDEAQTQPSGSRAHSLPPEFGVCAIPGTTAICFGSATGHPSGPS